MPSKMRSGLEILLGRERYTAISKASHLTGTSMATIIRDAIDAHLDQLEHRHGVPCHDDVVIDIRDGRSGRHRRSHHEDLGADLLPRASQG